MFTTDYADGRADQISSKSLQNQQLPGFPHGGQDHRHQRVEWRRKVDNLMAGQGLLATAKTGTVSSRGQMINDMPMHMIPSLEIGEAGYESRVALRAQHIIKNQANKMQRCRIWLDDLTKIYSLLYACVVEVNMTLAGELLSNCDMSERPPIVGASAWSAAWTGIKPTRS
jgi:hypothetical protein